MSSLCIHSRLCFNSSCPVFFLYFNLSSSPHLRHLPPTLAPIALKTVTEQKCSTDAIITSHCGCHHPHHHQHPPHLHHHHIMCLMSSTPSSWSSNPSSQIGCHHHHHIQGLHIITSHAGVHHHHHQWKYHITYWIW